MNPQESKNDQELIAALKAGDRQAFEEIYHRYFKPLYRYVADRVDRIEDCEEIIQETFIWVWTHRSTLGHVTEIRAYLYGIVKHKIFNYIRHSIIRREYVEYFLRFGNAIDNTTEENSSVADVRQTLEDSIRQLPERCQAAFRMSRMDKLAIPAIAQKMEISTRTVENYITQALKHLRHACRDFYNAKSD